MMMRKMQISPNLPLFNLLLRTVRDCGVGNPDFIQKLSLKIEIGTDIKDEVISHGRDIGKANEPYISLFPSNGSEEYSNIMEKNSVDNDNSKAISNSFLLAKDSDHEISSISKSQSDSGLVMGDNLNQLLSFDDMKKPENRLAVVGGLTGFLEQMEMRNVQPDIRTFSQLLDVLPSNVEAEEKLLSVMDAKSIKPDVDLYNMLIHKRCMRRDYEEARVSRLSHLLSVLEVIYTVNTGFIIFLDIL